MRTASARAARPARKGGLPNVVFLAADARTLPTAFLGRIDELRIVLPWGSLLQAVLAADPRLVALVADGLRPGGRVRIVTSVTPVDVASVGAPVAAGRLTALGEALESAGLRILALRPFEAADVPGLRSSWARRLGIPTRRPATVLEARRRVVA